MGTDNLSDLLFLQPPLPDALPLDRLGAAGQDDPVKEVERTDFEEKGGFVDHHADPLFLEGLEEELLMLEKTGIKDLGEGLPLAGVIEENRLQFFLDRVMTLEEARTEFGRELTTEKGIFLVDSLR